MDGPRHGVAGGPMVDRIVRRRFRSLGWSEEQIQVIADYLYHITAAPGSGEYSMNSLLVPLVRADTSRPGVFAREPLVHKMNSLSIPINVLYGDNDWLYHKHECDSAISHLRREGLEAEQVANDDGVDMRIEVFVVRIRRGVHDVVLHRQPEERLLLDVEVVELVGLVVVELLLGEVGGLLVSRLRCVRVVLSALLQESASCPGHPPWPCQ